MSSHFQGSGAPITPMARARQLTLIFLAAVLVLAMLGIRITARPPFDEAELSVTYDQLCLAWRNEQPLDSLQRRARDHVRRTSFRVDTVMLYQLIQAERGELQQTEALEAIEGPIRAALRRGDFAEARRLTHEGAATPELAEMRSELWIQLIDRLERRWARGCVSPSTSPD